MSTNRKQRAGAALAGAVIVFGASALVQPNGGLIPSAFADDESPKESLKHMPTVKMPAGQAPAGVQQPTPQKRAVRPAAPIKKSTVPAPTSPQK